MVAFEGAIQDDGVMSFTDVPRVLPVVCPLLDPALEHGDDLILVGSASLTLLRHDLPLETAAAFRLFRAQAPGKDGNHVAARALTQAFPKLSVLQDGQASEDLSGQVDFAAHLR